MRQSLHIAEMWEPENYKNLTMSESCSAARDRRGPSNRLFATRGG